jgi:non-specific serine/threonine protein kinase
MIGDKIKLSRDLLEGGGERLLTEMDNQELLRFVSLDIHKAVEV